MSSRLSCQEDLSVIEDPDLVTVIQPAEMVAELVQHAVFDDDLSPGKARILLMLALPQTKDQGELQAFFDK